MTVEVLLRPVYGQLIRHYQGNFHMVRDNFVTIHESVGPQRLLQLLNQSELKQTMNVTRLNLHIVPTITQTVRLTTKTEAKVIFDRRVIPNGLTWKPLRRRQPDHHQ